MPPVVACRGTKAKPSREIATVRKTLPVTDGSHQRGYAEHADPRNGGQASGSFVLAGTRGKFVVEGTNAVVQ